MDIKKPTKNSFNVKFIKTDAKEFVKNSKHFDSVIVDLCDEKDICDFVTTREFVDDLKRIANYIVVNTFNNKNMSAYSHLKLAGINKPSGLANKIYYYQTKSIPNLHIFKRA